MYHKGTKCDGFNLINNYKDVKIYPLFIQAYELSYFRAMTDSKQSLFQQS